MAYSPEANGAMADARFKEMVGEIFHKVIPPDTRMWMSNGLKIEVYRNNTILRDELRIQYRPTTNVVPTETINISMAIEHQLFEAVVKGQYDMFDKGQIEDFFLKCLMVYEMKPYEYGSEQDGWK